MKIFFFVCFRFFSLIVISVKQKYRSSDLIWIQHRNECHQMVSQALLEWRAIQFGSNDNSAIDFPKMWIIDQQVDQWPFPTTPTLVGIKTNYEHNWTDVVDDDDDDGSRNAERKTEEKKTEKKATLNLIENKWMLNIVIIFDELNQKT